MRPTCIYGILIASAAFLMTGCETVKPLYHWGQYEESLYQSYTKPDKVTPSVLAQRLEEDLEKATAKDLKPNPGLHAQLGVLYFNMGRFDDAKRQFEIEKALFPESAVLMDRMLGQFKGPQTQ